MLLTPSMLPCSEESGQSSNTDIREEEDYAYELGYN